MTVVRGVSSGGILGVVRKAYGFIKQNGARILLTSGPIAAAALAITFVHCTSVMMYSLFNVRMWRWYSDHPSGISVPTGEFYFRGILFAAVILITTNTFVYLSDSWKRQDGVAHVLNGLSLAIAFSWLGHIAVGWLTWPNTDDIAALCLFGLFLVTDLRFYRGLRDGSRIRRQQTTMLRSESLPAATFRATSRKRQRQKLEIERQTFLLQIYAVDLPVIFGISCTAFGANVLFSATPVAVADSGAQAFDAGFRVGTLVMHLAISQFLFILIYTIYFIRIFRLDRQA